MEQGGTIAPSGEKQRVSPFFSSPSSAARQRGDSPTPLPPTGEKGVGESHPPMPTAPKAEAAEWVRQHLPTCAVVAATFREVFGDVRLVYASENGHVIGQKSPDGVKLSETLVGPMAVAKRAGR